MAMRSILLSLLVIMSVDVFAEVSMQMQIEADTLLRATEDEIKHIHGLPAAQRYKEELKLGSKLQRLERKIRGTKANNKVLYLLANWQVTYDKDAAWSTIEQLEASPYLPHKGTANLIKIRYHLENGDTEQARTLAEKVTEAMPEFISTMDLVNLYERRGEAAPDYKGKHLSGPYNEPLNDAPDAFILYVFGKLNDDWQRFHTEKICQELQEKAYKDKFHIVYVSFDSKFLPALGTWREIDEDMQWDLFWANPSRNGDAEDWKLAWKVYTMPAYILVGPQREILEINPSIEELRILAGIKKKNEGNKNNGKGRRRGKGPRW